MLGWLTAVALTLTIVTSSGFRYRQADIQCDSCSFGKWGNWYCTRGLFGRPPQSQRHRDCYCRPKNCNLWKGKQLMSFRFENDGLLCCSRCSMIPTGKMFDYCTNHQSREMIFKCIPHGCELSTDLSIEINQTIIRYVPEDQRPQKCVSCPVAHWSSWVGEECGKQTRQRISVCQPPNCCKSSGDNNGISKFNENRVVDCTCNCTWIAVNDWNSYCGEAQRTEQLKCGKSTCKTADGDFDGTQRVANKVLATCCTQCKWVSASSWSTTCGKGYRHEIYTCNPLGCIDKNDLVNTSRRIERTLPECCTCSAWSQWQPWICPKQQFFYETASRVKVRNQVRTCTPRNIDCGEIERTQISNNVCGNNIICKCFTVTNPWMTGHCAWQFRNVTIVCDQQSLQYEKCRVQHLVTTEEKRYIACKLMVEYPPQ